MKEKKLHLDPYYIEYAMDHCFHKLTGKQRKYIYSDHRAKRLQNADYLMRVDVKHPSYTEAYHDGIWYWPTKLGLKWWIGERAKTAVGRYVSVEAPFDPIDVKTLAEALEGKGVGSHIRFFVNYNQAVWEAMRKGLLEFVSHRDYSGMPRSMEEYVTASLTLKGQQFYDSLPRLLLECA